MKNNVVTISMDITIDDEKAVLIDSIISKFDEAGRDVSFIEVLELAFGACNASRSTLTKTLEFMDNKLTRELETLKKRGD